MRAVVGLYGGYASILNVGLYDLISYDSTTTASPSSVSGMVYGAKIGALYEFNKHNEMNFGVKLEQIPFKRHTSSYGEFSNKITDTNYGLYIGYNYKF